MSKTLTFGTVPSFEEFSAAMCAAINNGTFGIVCNGSDRSMMDACGLPNQTRFTALDLYELVESLAAINAGHVSHGEPWTDEQMEWAGSFASSILSTLDFEWV